MSEQIAALLPLIIMTVVVFFTNRWIGKRCNAWTTKLFIISLLPAINYIGTILIFVTAIQKLIERVEFLESKQLNKV